MIGFGKERTRHFCEELFVLIDHVFPVVQLAHALLSALAEGKFDELPDNHLSRAPVELDREGWSEVVVSLARTLDEVLEAHARSAERAYASGEQLMAARVVMMQFPIGREDPRERDTNESVIES